MILIVEHTDCSTNKHVSEHDYFLVNSYIMVLWPEKMKRWNKLSRNAVYIAEPNHRRVRKSCELVKLYNKA